MKTWSVFGIYEDNMQRCGFSVEAEDPDGAELAAREAANEGSGGTSRLWVAAVLEGSHSAQDSYNDGDEGPGWE